MISDIVQPLRVQLEEFFYTQDNRQATEAGSSVDLAQDAVMYGLRREVMHGNTAGLLTLFSPHTDVKSHSITAAIAGEYASQLTSQLQVPGNVADKLAVHIVPAIIQAISSYVAVDGMLDAEKLRDVIAGDLGTLRDSLEAGVRAARAQGLGDKATGILGFGIGGKYE